MPVSVTNGTAGGWMFLTAKDGSAFVFPPIQNTAFYPDRGSIYPFVKSTGVYVCPDDSSGQGNSYSINSMVVGIAISRFSDPASTVVFNEESDGYPGGSQSGSDDAYFDPTAVGFNVPTTRHNNGAVFAFQDGHAKWYSNGTLVYQPCPPAGPCLVASNQPRYQPYLPY